MVSKEIYRRIKIMRTTATTGPIFGIVGEDEGIRLIAKAGYDCLDFGLGSLTKMDSPWLNPDYKEHAAHIVELCKENGICVGQTHTPFLFRWEDPDDFKNIAMPNTIRSLEVSGLLGAPIAIVHPLHHLCYKDYGTMEYKQNIDFYKALLPYAKEYNVKIALENMFQYDNNGVTIPDMYADIDEFKRAFDDLGNDPQFVACVDVGHCGLGRCCTAGDMIRALGHDYVHALHVHDNDNQKDRHTVPYLGTMDWDDICAALKEIKYDGDMCMEVLGGYYKRFTDPELLLDAIHFANRIGRHLAKKIEE